MSVSLFPSDNILLLAAGIAAASLLLAGVGLIVARLAGRCLPLRHGLLLTTLLLILALPLLTPAAAMCGLGWRVTDDSRDSTPPRDAEPPPAIDPVTPGAPITPLASPPPAIDADERPQPVPVWSEAPAFAPIATEYRPEHAATIDTPAAIEAIPHPAERDAPAAGAAPPQPVSSPAVPLRTAGSALLALWLLGGVVCLLRGGMAALRLRRLMRRASIVHDAALTQLLQQSAQDVGLRKTPRLLAATDIPIPFVHGLRRPSVFLPAALLGDSTPALRAILLHELAHIRRRDLLAGRMQRVATAIYWWNPLVHRLNSRLDEAREDLCDNHVLRHTGDPRGYANLLVDTASRAVGASIVPAIGLFSRRPAPFSQRINRLLQENRPMSTSLGRVSRVLLVVFAFALGVCSTLFVVLKEDLRASISFDTSSRRANIVDMQLPAQVETVTFAANHSAPSIRDVAAPPRETHEYANADFDLEFADEPAFPGFVAGPESGDFSGDFAPAEAEATTIPTSEPALALEWDPFRPAGAADTFAPGGTAPVPIRRQDDNTGFSPFAPQDRAGLIIDPVTGAPVRRSPPQSGLVIVRLEGNEDGSLKELRYLTEDLGNGDDAFDSLRQRIESWIQTIGPNGISRTTEVQIAADPKLRYEHVARAVSVCEPHVDRVSFARPESVQRLDISIGFLRDAEGTRIVDQSVIFVGESLVQRGEVHAALTQWRSENPAVADAVTIAIRADADVGYKVVEEIVQAAQQAGFSRFALRSLEQSPQQPTGKIERLIEIDIGGVTQVEVTLGAHQGIRPGQRLIAWAPNNPAGTVLEVVEVNAASSICRVIAGGQVEPQVGHLVALHSENAAAEPPAVEPPVVNDPLQVIP